MKHGVLNLVLDLVGVHGWAGRHVSDGVLLTEPW